MHATRHRTRDKVSNGRILPTTVDLRSRGGRRFQFLVAAYSAELGGELSEAERSLVHQAVALQLEGEKLQERIVRGEDIDADQLIRISSTSKRLLSIIASKAGKRNPAAGPSVEDLFAVPDDAEAEEEAGAE